MSKISIHERITNELIDAMQSEYSWKAGISGLAEGMPVNSKGNYYSGINILLLWFSTGENKFTSNQWMTYKQAKEKGYQVRKGEKGTGIIFYTTWNKENEKGDMEHIPVLKSYTVFNTCQIDGITDTNSITYEWNPIEAGENLFASSECPVITEVCTPCYIPSVDQIKLPAKNQFDTAENYYTTLAHEMSHSTGHKSRLDRLTDKNKRGYAFEELIAELSAVFTCAKLGIKGNVENHASYLKSWLSAMANDKKYIFQAATQASKASDYLINNIKSVSMAA